LNPPIESHTVGDIGAHGTIHDAFWLQTSKQPSEILTHGACYPPVYWRQD